MQRQRHRRGLDANHCGPCLIGNGLAAGEGRCNGFGLARDGLDVAAGLAVEGDAVAHRVDAFIAGPQGVGVDCDAVGPGQIGASGQTARGLQASGDDHLVGGEVLAAFGGDPQPRGLPGAGGACGQGLPESFGVQRQALDAGHLHLAHETDRQPFQACSTCAPALSARQRASGCLERRAG